MSPAEYYGTNVSELERKLSRLKSNMFAYSMLRLSVFVIMAVLMYIFRNNWLFISIDLVAGFSVFFFLVGRYTDLKNQLRYLLKLKWINERELKALQGNFAGLKSGEEYIYEVHPYNQDIDLFGQGSLFQLINRTATSKGEARLAYWLNSNDINNIQQKQIAIDEISKKADWRQDYSTIAGLINTEVDTDTILGWIHNYKAFVPGIFKWLPIFFTALSIGMISLYATGIIGGYLLLGWFFLGLAITGKYLKKITELYNITSKINDVLEQYSKLLQKIEKQQFESELLQNWQESIQTEGIKASVLLEKLSKEIALLSNRNNMIFAPVANGFMLWDLRYSYRIEHWLEEFDGAVHDWFKIIETFDAMNSLGNFKFNHPEYIYPELSDNPDIQLVATEIGHPLIDEETMVTNSIDVNTTDFFIITGANMAGKSTFLRTIAVNIVMINNGLPVCAKSFVYRPVKLISSMRTSDSLMNEESYFFSELKRLKFIVNAIQEDTYFIILDEILKGTNSKDKAEGSQKFVEKLVASASTGLIATHDLSLCSLENKLPQIRNYYFDAEIVNDELHFDYTFKKGICQNMNASFLLKKMGIV